MQRESTGVRSQIVWKSWLNPQQTVSEADQCGGSDGLKRSKTSADKMLLCTQNNWQNRISIEVI